MDVGGGMISFQVRDPRATALQLSDRLKVIHYAFSLGHQRSIVVLLDTEEMMQSTYRLEGKQREAYRAFAGDGIFRLSIGLEAPQDLVVDLGQALTR